MPVKACIFDFDGTLADSMWVWADVFTEFLEKRGKTLSYDLMSAVAALGYHDGAVYTIQRYGLSDDPEDIVCEWLASAEERYATKVHLRPGAREFVQKLRKQGVKTAVASAQRRSLMEMALTNGDALDLFDELLVCDEVTANGKATPEVYWETARRLGVDPSETIVFEDGARPARQANIGGFMTIGVYDDTPSQDHEALKAEVDRFVMGFGELLESSLDCLIGK